jgi:multicomponent Na+:H+ antiporter subunit B
VTLLVGVDVVVHGHLTPGGAFQGGVVLASGVHLLYLTGSFDALLRARTDRWPNAVEPAGSGLFAVVGLIGVALGAGFGANVLPVGTLGDTISSGTVLVLDLAVGLGVGAGLVHLLAQFLRQEIVVRRS